MLVVQPGSSRNNGSIEFSIDKLGDFKDAINQANALLGLAEVDYNTINDAYNGMVDLVDVLRDYIDEHIADPQ